jgi:adenylate cyclase
MKKQSNTHDNGLSLGHRDSQVTPDGIRAQLDRVLSSPDFKASEKVKTIFRYLTEETLSGNNDHIDAHRIAAEAHSRPSDASPPIDPIVRIQLNQLRRAIKGYYAGAGATDDGLRIEMPEDRCTPVFYSEKE